MELMNKKIVEANIQLQDENKELKKIIKTAIEYIESLKFAFDFDIEINKLAFDFIYTDEGKELLKILKGEEYEQ